MEFFIFATLALWLRGVKTRFKPYFWAAGILGAMGLYTYHGYKIFPLLVVVCFLYETVRDKGFLKSHWAALATMASLFLALTAPSTLFWIQRKSIGDYEMGLFIGHRILLEKSLAPFFRNLFETFLMFNRTGDSAVLHNYQSHRMLDDVTGVFWILGLFYAFRFFKVRKYFYGLAGIGVMSLNCLLTVDAAQANRMPAWCLSWFFWRLPP